MRNGSVRGGNPRCALIAVLSLVSLVLLPLHAFAKGTPTKAPRNPGFIEYLRQRSLATAVETTASGHALGLIPPPIVLPAVKAGGKTLGAHAGFGIPASYDLRKLGKVTPVEDQGACGACWAFATYGSMESILMPDESRNFSENHLKNQHGFDWECCAGGNHFMSTAYMARWDGPVNQSEDAYNDSCISPPGLAATKHVQNVLFIPDRTGPLDNDGIKQAVMTYGGIYTSMAWNSASFQTLHNAYYYSGSGYSNHSVTVVGWDDSFDKSKFATAAPGNGAFLAKNSWGTSFGESGYFWVSYYDTRFGKENAAFLAEPTSNYNGIYQYDTLGWVDSVGYTSNTAYFANVFSVTRSDLLAAASFYVASPNSSYQIDVYADPSSGPIGPSGPAVSQTGTIAEPGYRTIPLSQQIMLATGHTFSVVVKLTTPGFNFPIPLESPESGYSSRAGASPGQSYISSDGLSWSDVTTQYAGSNACIKAFTFAGTLFVKPSGSDSANGLSWATAKRSVSAALTAALPGMAIWAAGGVYKENVVLRQDVCLYGGFAGSETQQGQRNWAANATILEGNQGGPVVTVPPGITGITRLDGFTLRNGTGKPIGNALYGGGIYCDGSSPVIVNNTITANSAHWGGGIWCSGNSTPQIISNLIARNTAQDSRGVGAGGGIYCKSSAPLLTNNTIASNHAPEGGGIYLESSSPFVTNSIIAGNSSGIRNAGGMPVLRRNCVYGNTAYQYSGLGMGEGDLASDPVFRNLEGGDYHLQAGSPCIDAGDDAAVQRSWFDVDAEPRVLYQHVDIGADEYRPAAYPIMAVDTAEVRFGRVYVGYPGVRNLLFSNSGTAALNVEIAANHAGLSATPNGFSVAPNQSRVVVVQYAPGAPETLSATLTVTSDDTRTPTLAIPVTGDAANASALSITPASFTKTLPAGEAAQDSLSICNTGTGAGEFSATVEYEGGAPPGYEWKDSTMPGGPAYSWIDVSATGTAVTGLSDDNYVGSFPIGFDFKYYGTPYSRFYVASNGFIGFGPPSSYEAFSNTGLPNTATPNNILCWNWDDLYPVPETKVFYETTSDGLVVQFNNVGAYGSPARITAEVILKPNGEILFQYQDVGAGWPQTSATVGIENADGTQGVQIAFNAPYVRSNLAVRLFSQGWLQVEPASGSVSAGDCATPTVTMDSAELLQGDYFASIAMQTNDPLKPSLRIPVVLHVVGFSKIEAGVGSLDFGSVFVGYPVTRTVTISNSGSAALEVTGIELPDAAVTASPLTFTLAPGKSQGVTVTYAPTGSGTLVGSMVISSNDPKTPTLRLGLQGSSLFPPCISFAPGSFAKTLRPGETAQDSLAVSNACAGSLDLSLGVEYGANANSAGYRWLDSTMSGGPAYKWVEIADTGTDVAGLLDDNFVGALPIGFDFRFYGQEYRQFYISSNGFVGFGPTVSYSSLQNTPLPSLSAPNNIVCWNWDDLVPQSDTRVIYQTTDDGLVIEFVNYGSYGSSAARITAEIVLCRGGDVLIQYRSVSNDWPLMGSTIGIESATGQQGSQVAYNTPYVRAELAVRFFDQDWLSVSPLTAVVAPNGGSLPVDLTFNTAKMLPGDYTADVQLRSNDPTNPLVKVPVSLHVTGLPVISVSASSLALGSVYVGYKASRQFSVSNSGPEPLEVSGITSGHPGLTASPSAFSVPAGGFQVVTVDYAPTAPESLSAILSIDSNDPSTPACQIAVTGTALSPPAMTVTPDRLAALVEPGKTGQAEIAIGNAGASPLDFAESVTYTSGGPVLGYQFKDSTMPGGPTFNWIDISGTGTEVTGLALDSCLGPFPIGFDFRFYDSTYQQFYIPSHGFIGFGPTDGYAAAYGNVPIPNPSTPNNIICWMWDDVFAQSDTHVYYQSTSEGLVVQYNSYGRYGYNAPRATAEIILRPGGEILIQYLSISADWPNSATVGVENATGTKGTQVVCDAPYVHSNLAVRFQSQDWLQVSPSAGSVLPGQAGNLSVTYDATNLPQGDYRAEIQLLSNDPARASVTVPVTLSVLAPPDAPSGPSPSDGASWIPASAPLQWQACARAQEYDLFLWKCGGTKPANPTAGGLVGPSFQPAASLDSETCYSWQVVARNAAGSVAGPIWSFSTAGVGEIFSTTGGFVKTDRWNLISVPADPVSPDPLVVFSGIDVGNASFQFWRNNTSGGGYQLYGETFGWTGPVMRGTPYWFRDSSGSSSKDIHFAGYAPTSDFEVTLAAHPSAPYWVMFGTPFPNPVSVSALRFKSGTLQGGNWVNWVQAFSQADPSQRIVDGNALGWNTSLSNFIIVGCLSGYDSFEPWWGYWMLVYDKSEVRIKFPEP